MKRILLLVLCLALFACTEEPKPGKIVSIELTEENLTILVGEFGNTIAYVEMDNPANCNSTVEWSSSNESIAVAHANGDECLIEGISPGEAIITANTPEGLSATCKVTVVAKVIPVTGISLSRAWLEILENRTETLTAFLKPSDATNTKVTWSSTDESIATVNDGTVRGIKPGRAKIKAETEDGGFVAECDVTVTKDYQSQSKGPVTLKLGNVTASTVTFFGTLDVDQLGDYDMDDGGVGFIYTTTDKTLNVSNAKKVNITNVGSNNEFSFTYTDLLYDTRYHYTVFLYKNGICQYGSTQYFKTEDVNINVDEVTTGTSSATFKGTTSLLWGDRSAINVGIQYSKYDSFSSTATINLSDSTETFEYKREGLSYATKYYYRTYIKQNGSYKYGNAQEFTTQSISVSIGVDNLTQTTATFSGNTDLVGGEGISVGVRYWPVSGGDTRSKSLLSEIDENGNYSITVKDLKHGTQYRYSYYIYQNSSYIYYGDTQEFTTEAIPVTISADEITQTTAIFTGNVSLSEQGVLEVGLLCSSSESDPKTTTSGVSKVVLTDLMDADGNYSYKAEGLLNETTHYYRYYVKQGTAYTYGDVMDFKTESVPMTMSVNDITQTTATFTGNISLSEKDVLEVGLLYSSSTSDPKATTSGVSMVVLTDLMDADGNYSHKAEGLLNETTQYYRYYVKQGTAYTYGDVMDFKTEMVPVTIAVDNIDRNMVTFKGNVQFSEPGVIELGIQYYPKAATNQSAGIQTKAVTEISGDGDFVIKISNLLFATEYYWQYYLLQDGVTILGLPQTFETEDLYKIQSNLNLSSATDLSSTDSANCYIISESGLYKFKTVKGNGSESVGSVSSAEILWESFGTSVAPQYLNLIRSFCYKNGYIAFQTADTFKEGNAVIAAKDASGNILWSWHIWFTDQPQAQVYNNDAGTMMDRNLGATSATPGDVGALGLLYQWGRKDPFLGSSSISSSIRAASTITWPSSVSSDSYTGTIDYATANPTTFIESNYDWYYTSSSSTDNTRWTTLGSAKSIYDPCPAGWRVPDGGSNGIWKKAGFDNATYDSTNMGISFSISSPSTTWYPASGSLHYNCLTGTGGDGEYLSASTSSFRSEVYILYFANYGVLDLSCTVGRSRGASVRCLQESK